MIKIPSHFFAFYTRSKSRIFASKCLFWGNLTRKYLVRSYPNYHPWAHGASLIGTLLTLSLLFLIIAIFDDAKDRLAEEIVNWGYCESKDDFFQVLSTANVALSTSNHEFFGVSM